MNKTGLALTVAVHGLVLVLAMQGTRLHPKAEAAVLTTRLIPATVAAAPAPTPQIQKPTLPTPALPAPLSTPEFQVTTAAEPSLAPPSPPVQAAPLVVAVAAVPAQAAIRAEPAQASYQPASLPPEHGSCSARGVERHYPALLRERGVQGQVLLRVQVNEQGRAAEVQVQGGSGWRLLDEAARQIAMACPYLPARRGEQRLAAWVEYPIRFALH